MPPKKQQKPNAKTEQKKKDKIVEDKTFGLKNKKGGKQQKFIKNVTQQVKHGGTPSARKQEQIREEERKKKEEKKKGMSEIDALFRPVVQQNKVGKGADPKSVLCAFFKQGSCQKGAKCKFSHDLTIERKSEKRSMYLDTREEDLKQDTMDDWDENKLQEVVEKKHGAVNKTKTEKVCKFFLQAIEDKKYGWFWVCPNGGDSCMYRHALPPGFVLKSDQNKMAEQEEKISIEDLIETERAALGPNVTKITLESFLVWKKRKREEKMKTMMESKDKRKNEYKSGVQMQISGREMFEFQPDMIDQDDAEADSAATYTAKREEADINEKVKDLSLNDFTLTDNAVSIKGQDAKLSKETVNGAVGGTDNDITQENANAPQIEEVPVDEDLFTEDLDDLEDLE